LDDFACGLPEFLRRYCDDAQPPALGSPRRRMIVVRGPNSARTHLVVVRFRIIGIRSISIGLAPENDRAQRDGFKYRFRHHPCNRAERSHCNRSKPGMA